jgi:hypothetical protein
MSEQFRKPIFDTRTIELRFENNEVCIYATKSGLKKIAELCETLIENPKRAHIHLEDYELLTKDSLYGTIAVFEIEESK